MQEHGRARPWAGESSVSRTSGLDSSVLLLHVVLGGQARSSENAAPAPILRAGAGAPMMHSVILACVCGDRFKTTHAHVFMHAHHAHALIEEGAYVSERVSGICSTFTAGTV